MASAPSNHALSKAPLPSRTLNGHTRQLKSLQATVVEKAEPWLKAKDQRNLCLIFSRPITLTTLSKITGFTTPSATSQQHLQTPTHTFMKLN